MPHGVYQRKPETIQKLREQMKKIGRGRKGKKYASTEPHAQPMEEMTPTPAKQTLKVGENKLNNNDKKMVEEEQKNEETTGTPETLDTPEEPEIPKEPAEEPRKPEPEPEPVQKPTPSPNRPLTGPEIRKMQEESGKR